MGAFPTLPDLTGGALTDQQLNQMVAGILYAGKGPACFVTRSASASVASGASTNITFDGKSFDNNSFISISSSTITLNDAGLYVVAPYALWALNATGVRTIEMYANGSGTAFGASTIPGNTTTGFIAAASGYAASAGDTITIKCAQNSGGALNLTSASALIARVSGS